MRGRLERMGKNEENEGVGCFNCFSAFVLFGSSSGWIQEPVWIHLEFSMDSTGTVVKFWCPLQLSCLF